MISPLMDDLKNHACISIKHGYKYILVFFLMLVNASGILLKFYSLPYMNLIWKSFLDPNPNPNYFTSVLSLFNSRDIYMDSNHHEVAGCPASWIIFDMLVTSQVGRLEHFTNVCNSHYTKVEFSCLFLIPYALATF